MATVQPPGTGEASLWPGRPDLPPSSRSETQQAELDGVPAAEPRAGRGSALAQEALGIEVGPEVLEVGAVGPQRGDPTLEVVAHVAGVGRISHTVHQDPASPAPRLQP